MRLVAPARVSPARNWEAQRLSHTAARNPPRRRSGGPQAAPRARAEGRAADCVGEGPARLQRYVGFRGDSSKKIPLPPLSNASGARQKRSTSFSPPSSPRRLPGPSPSASAQGSGPAHPRKKPLPLDSGDDTSWAGRGGPGIWGGGYLEPFEDRPRARSDRALGADSAAAPPRR